MAAKKKQIAKKEVLTFEYPCYICGNILSKAKQVINHVETIHGYKIPTRQVGHKRPMDPQYDYNNDPETEEDYDVCHYACSSCWFHCPQAGLKELADHVNSVHHPQNVNPEKNKNGAIKGGEVTDSDATKHLNQEKHNANKAEGIEESDDEQDGEDQVMAETNDKAAKKDMGDVYQKLNELVDMFQKLLKKKDNKD